MESESNQGNVVVCCRARPLNEKELKDGDKSCLKFEKDGKGVTIDKGDKKFNFDKVFGPESTQRDVYNFAAKPIIDSVL